MHWTQDSINEYDFKDAWEWEFRPNNSVSTWDIWGEKQNFLTNLPNGYYEHTSNDHDDVAIGAHSLQNASTSTSYYGYLAMEPLYPASYPTFQLESEYCYDGGYLTYPVGDAIPIRYELFPTNAQINTDYYW